MDALIRAASDFLAALLGALGFVGRPRKRDAIRQDLALLRELDTFPDDFTEEKRWTRTVLAQHLALEVAKYSGVELPRKKRHWDSIVMAALIGAPLGYWTYKINEHHFHWYSLFPGIVAGLMAVAILGMLFSPEEQTPTSADQQPSAGPSTSQGSASE